MYHLPIPRVFWGPRFFFRPFPCHPPYTSEVGVPMRRLKMLAKFALPLYLCGRLPHRRPPGGGEAPLGIRLKSTRPSHGQVCWSLHPPEARQTSKPTEGQAPTRMRAPCRSNSRPRALVSVGAGGYFLLSQQQKNITLCNDVRIITRKKHRTPLVFGACVWRCCGIRRREYGTGLLPFVSACGVAHGCGVCVFFLFFYSFILKK